MSVAGSGALRCPAPCFGHGIIQVQITERVATMDKAYSILTYGCQMNENDSEILAGILVGLGYRETESFEEADIILINTCSIRETAVRKILGRLSELKTYKERNPDLLLGVCGCLPEHHGELEKIRQRAPFLDLIFGTHSLHQLPELIDRARESAETIVQTGETGEIVPEGLPRVRSAALKAWVTITYGCDNFCSYCVVPYTRGRERSRRSEDILEEIARLTREGLRDITLLGQNVNSYGRDLLGPETFAGLLARADRIDGVGRLRFMTSHPKDLSLDLVEAMAAGTNICEHIHLPVQSGSNAVLEMMRRGYTREKYLAMVDLIRSRLPGCSLTTDIIVGFPGESEDDFQQTIDLIEKARFDSAFTFLYSPRTGTPAATMPEQVPTGLKKERLSRLMEVQNRISLEINRSLTDRTFEVLVEGKTKKNPEFLQGRTRTNKLVVVPGNQSMVGRFLPVRITRAQTWNLFGEALMASEANRE